MVAKRSFDDVLLKTVEASVHDTQDEITSKAVRFFLDERTVVRDPDAFANSLRKMLGEEGVVSVKRIQDRLQEAVRLDPREWPSLGALVSRAREVYSRPFTSRLNTDGHFTADRVMLLEVDPSTPFEALAAYYAEELLSNGYEVSAFTFRGSPVIRALSGLEGIRFHVMTSKVTFPRDVEGSHETLVPRDNAAVLLNLLDKVATASSGSRPGLIFDNLSVATIHFGAENFIKFVMQANELLTERHAASLFLMVIGAQDEKLTNLVRSLFQDHLVCDANGFRLSKGGTRTEERDWG